MPCMRHVRGQRWMRTHIFHAWKNIQKAFDRVTTNQIRTFATLIAERGNPSN